MKKWIAYWIIYSISSEMIANVGKNNFCKSPWFVHFQKSVNLIVAKFRQNFIKIEGVKISKFSDVFWKRSRTFGLAKNVEESEKLLKFVGLTGAKIYKSCRSRQWLSNKYLLILFTIQYLLAKICLDTAENEPFKVACKRIYMYCSHVRKSSLHVIGQLSRRLSTPWSAPWRRGRRSSPWYRPPPARRSCCRIPTWAPCPGLMTTRQEAYVFLKLLSNIWLLVIFGKLWETIFAST